MYGCTTQVDGTSETTMGEAKRRKLARKNPRVGMHRLVILEWLKDNECRTGARLNAALLAASKEVPVEYIECRNAFDVLGEIQRLTADVVATGNVPILQIEAHGYEAADGRGVGFSGPSGEAHDEILPWDVLAVELRELNIATQFNLIFIGAACLSDYAIHMLESGSDPSPFVFFVGFEGEVDDTRLLAAMVALHKGTLVDGLSFHASMKLARQCLDPATETLASFWLPEILRKVGLDAAFIIGDPEMNGDLYMEMLAERSEKGLPPVAPQAFHRDQASLAPAAIEEMISKVLAYDRVPENRRRFGLDGAKLAAEARRTNHKPSAAALERAALYRR
jgi:hypothetical protein